MHLSIVALGLLSKFSDHLSQGKVLKKKDELPLLAKTATDVQKK